MRKVSEEERIKRNKKSNAYRKTHLAENAAASRKYRLYHPDLQVIPAILNMSKSNRVWPNMPTDVEVRRSN